MKMLRWICGKHEAGQDQERGNKKNDKHRSNRWVSEVYAAKVVCACEKDEKVGAISKAQEAQKIFFKKIFEYFFFQK